MRTNLNFKTVITLTFFFFIATHSLWAQQTFTVSGRVTTPAGSPLQNAAVFVSGTVNDMVLADANGNYQFSLPANGAYTITPYNNCHPLNGVSTYDMVLIGYHANAEELLDSPYKIIAADAAPDGVIDSLDIIEVRALILGIIGNYTNNTSWRFVAANHVFPDSLNPFPFPESFIINDLTSNVSDVDFYGIKVGDVNSTAVVTPGLSACDGSWNSKITGIVGFDQNENCQNDAGEPALDDWIVVAENGTGDYFFSTAQSTGAYSISVPPDTYDVTAYPPNPLWENCVGTVENVSIGNFGVATADFSGQAIANCPLLEVDLSTPRLRRCFDNTYTVFYCNKGTALAEDAYVEIEFDPFLTVESSTLPWSSVDGNTYTFQLGDVEVGQCGSFNVVVNVSCDAELGQTHCSEARIYPDTICYESPLWNGASLEVEVECQNGEVIFTITNTGDAMTEPVNYIVIEDIMVQMTGGSIQLGSGESQTITIPSNGSTWRLEVDQVPNHPLNALVSATIEGCGENGNGTYSLGFVTQFPENEWGGHVDEDCQENIGSYDPNDKQGFPRGIFEEHFIPQGTEIEYLIRFQNTGTDTAFTVMILDTLSQFLDITTIRPGGSSHPYTFNMVGPGVAQFIFSNIMLPDSNVNEPASNGYVKFAIKPKSDLPNATAIENQAAIFFDFNAPVMTNTTLHTVGEKFLNVSTVVFRPGLELEIYPNPASVKATFFIKSVTPTEGILRLFDLQGKQILTQSFNTNTFEMDATRLTPGMYLFRIESGGGAIAAGKLAVQRRD